MYILLIALLGCVPKVPDVSIWEPETHRLNQEYSRWTYVGWNPHSYLTTKHHYKKGRYQLLLLTTVDGQPVHVTLEKGEYYWRNPLYDQYLVTDGEMVPGSKWMGRVRIDPGETYEFGWWAYREHDWLVRIYRNSDGIIYEVDRNTSREEWFRKKGEEIRQMQDAN